LKETVEAVPKEIPIIIDGKRNDIGSTAAAYAHALFSYYAADCVTLNPYLGYESVKPFLSFEDRGMFMLCRTSNPGSDKLQNLSVYLQSDAGIKGEQTPVKLYIHVAREVCSWSPNIGLVIGATVPEAIREIRREFPEVWMLCPGIGAQGGSLEESLDCGLREDGMGILPMVGRSIYQDQYPGEKAGWFCEQINKVIERRR
jgi:uridine monophosphate synthetase